MTPAELARLRADAERMIEAVDDEVGDDPLGQTAWSIIRAYIVALEAQAAAGDGWLSVTETEPAPGTRVIAVWGSCTDWGIRGYDGRWWAGSGASRPADQPTYYRPSPDPPKDKL